jgi:hypothetical protein
MVLVFLMFYFAVAYWTPPMGSKGPWGLGAAMDLMDCNRQQVFEDEVVFDGMAMIEN